MADRKGQRTRAQATNSSASALKPRTGPIHLRRSDIARSASFCGAFPRRLHTHSPFCANAERRVAMASRIEREHAEMLAAKARPEYTHTPLVARRLRGRFASSPRGDVEASPLDQGQRFADRANDVPGGRQSDGLSARDRRASQTRIRCTAYLKQGSEWPQRCALANPYRAMSGNYPFRGPPGDNPISPRRAWTNVQYQRPRPYQPPPSRRTMRTMMSSVVISIWVSWEYPSYLQSR